jgi:hypothetical protein
LTSRCTTPWPWAAASAPATCCSRRLASRGGSGPRLATRSASVSPSTYDMT